MITAKNAYLRDRVKREKSHVTTPSPPQNFIPMPLTSLQ